MSYTLFLLNCRNINNKLGDIKLMVYTGSPEIVAFNDTWLSKYMPKFVDYLCECKNRDSFAESLGFFIKKGVQYQNVKFNCYPNGYLEYQAIKVKTANGDLCVLNVYNQGRPVSSNELQFHVDQLGSKFVIVGDLNAHSKILDASCAKQNVVGVSIENILIENNICLINPIDFYTYISPSIGNMSCLDLCFTSPELASCTSMALLPDVGSDHSPISIKIEIRPEMTDIVYAKKWKIDDKDLQLFYKKMERDGRQIYSPNDVDSLVSDFTGRMFNVAQSVF